MALDKKEIGLESDHINCFCLRKCFLKLCVLKLSHVQLFATPWTVARQASLSMEFSRPEYWSGLACPPPGDFLNPGFEPRSPALQADFLPLEPPGKPFKTLGLDNLEEINLESERVLQFVH